MRRRDGRCRPDRTRAVIAHVDDGFAESPIVGGAHFDARVSTAST